MFSRLMKIVVPIFVMITAFPSPTSIRADSETPLPQDLLFSVNASENGTDKSILFRVDANTLELSEFYVDESANEIKALSWSPDGRKLAIIRLEQGRWQFCIISLEGIRDLCFDTEISFYAYRNVGVQTNDTVTWSADGETVYFLAENERKFSLIAADAITGELKEILYQHPRPYGEYPPRIFWSSDLQYLDIRYFDIATPDFDYEAVLNLATEQPLDLLTKLPKEFDNPILCEGFSPINAYMIAFTLSESTPQIPDHYFILDMQGNIVQSIENPIFNDYFVDGAGCPRWQSDEGVLFFVGNSGRYDSHIFGYSLEDDVWVVSQLPQPYIGYWNLFELNNPAASYPIVPSPNGTHIALEFISFQAPNTLNAVFVVSRDSEVLKVSGDYVARNPIWIPNVEP
ncbi:MAG: hypothetical protein BroJett018_23990 [Chloroflexota bacterium]|nr:hypothetical protein [Chloroflexota bacterium]NOG63345.1 hypothetical protein [Chloroflexota bacterium]GIK64605.1 MAG: hypothetical protein BroJett018_23990 [Chloroflexota bacterium]